MHGTPDDRPAPSPADEPEPPTVPPPADEPTVELPVVTAAPVADHPTSTPALAVAALTLARTRSSTAPPARSGEDWFPFDQFDLGAPGPARPANRKVRRTPALERRGPRPPSTVDNALPPAGPTAVSASGPGDEPPSGGTAATGPARRRLVGAGLIGAALLLTGATVVALSRDGGPGDVGAVGLAPPVVATGPPGPAAHVATGVRGGRTDAGFDVVDGAQRVTVRTAELGDLLYRVSTPAAGPVVPRTEERRGRVRLSLDGDAQAVDVTLNAAVRWNLRIAGGAALSTIDLGAGRVGGVDLSGGAGRIELTLPRPDGTLTVRMSGGVDRFAVRTAARVPVRVRVGSGAGRVTLDGRDHAGVAAGATFSTASWGAAVDRIDVDAAAGMSALTVDPY